MTSPNYNQYPNPTHPENYTEIPEAQPIPLRPGEYEPTIAAHYVPAESNIARSPEDDIAEEERTADILTEMKDLYNNQDANQHFEITPGHEKLMPHHYADPSINAAGLNIGDRFRRVEHKNRGQLNDKLQQHVFAGDTTAILTHLRDVVDVTKNVNDPEQANWKDKRTEAAAARREAERARYDLDDTHADLHHTSRHHPDKHVRRAAEIDMDNALGEWSRNERLARKAKREAQLNAPDVHSYGSELALDANPSRGPIANPEYFNVLSKMEAEHNTRVENVRTVHEAIQVSIDLIGRPDRVNNDPAATQAAIEDAFQGKALFDEALGELSEHDSTRAKLWEEGNTDTFRILHRVIVNRQMYNSPSDDPLYNKYPAHFNEDGSIRFNAGTASVVDYYPDGTVAFPEEVTEADGITPVVDPATGQNVIEMVRVNGFGEIATDPAVEVLDFKHDLKEKGLNDRDLDLLYQQWEVSRGPEDSALLHSELSRHIGEGQKQEKLLMDAFAKQEKRYENINDQIKKLRTAGAHASGHPDRPRYDELVRQRKAVSDEMYNHGTGISVRLELVRRTLNPKIAKDEFLKAGSGRKDAPELDAAGVTARRMRFNGIVDDWFIYPDGRAAHPAPGRPGMYEYLAADGVTVHVGP